MPSMASKNPVTSREEGRYSKEFLAGWGTMDFNGHMGNTAYLNLAADVRMAFFAEHGFHRATPASDPRSRRSFATARKTQFFAAPLLTPSVRLISSSWRALASARSASWA